MNHSKLIDLKKRENANTRGKKSSSWGNLDAWLNSSNSNATSKRTNAPPLNVEQELLKTKSDLSDLLEGTALRTDSIHDHLTKVRGSSGGLKSLSSIHCSETMSTLFRRNIGGITSKIQAPSAAAPRAKSDEAINQLTKAIVSFALHDFTKCSDHLLEQYDNSYLATGFRAFHRDLVHQTLIEG